MKKYKISILTVICLYIACSISQKTLNIMNWENNKILFQWIFSCAAVLSNYFILKMYED